MIHGRGSRDENNNQAYYLADITVPLNEPARTLMHSDDSRSYRYDITHKINTDLLGFIYLLFLTAELTRYCKQKVYFERSSSEAVLGTASLCQILPISAKNVHRTATNRQLSDQFFARIR